MKEATSAAGWGDTLTFGGTALARYLIIEKMVGYVDLVDTNSGDYSRDGGRPRSRDAAWWPDPNVDQSG